MEGDMFGQLGGDMLFDAAMNMGAADMMMMPPDAAFGMFDTMGQGAVMDLPPDAWQGCSELWKVTCSPLWVANSWQMP
jgi:hypothetical protein